MIQRPAQNTMVTNNTNESSSFSIDVSSGKAYQILADGIYRYKIAAIVRELMANCSDSHVDAGCREKPFRIKRPTIVNPVVEFEDFGTGIGYENIQKVYTSFFTSTKGDSNEVIGALGLGSKTPLAYTTGFSVRDRKDGVENTYTIYKGDDGVPKVALLGTMETTEPNGVCVSIPVKGEDFREFDKYIEFYSQFYQVAPVIHPSSEGRFDAIRETLDRDADFSVMERIRYTPDLYSGESLALMGAVPYPVTVDRNKLTQTEWAIYKFLRDCGTVVFNFDIGQLDISASRESLSEDPRTMATLHEKVKTALSKERIKYEKMMEEVTDEVGLYEFYRRDPIARSMVHDMAKSGALAAKNLGVFDDPSKFEETPRVLSRINRNRELYDARLFLHGGQSKQYRIYERYHYLRHEYFLSGGKIVFIEADRKNTSGMVKVAKSYSENNPDDVVFCLRKPLKKALKDDLMRELSYADVRFIPFSALRTVSRPAKARQKKEVNEFTACSINHTGYQQSGVITVVDAENFRYVDRWQGSIESLSVKSSSRKYIDIDDVPAILDQFFPEGMTVVIRTEANSKRIEKLGIKSFDQELAELKQSQDLTTTSELGKAVRKLCYGSRSVHVLLRTSHYPKARSFNEFVSIGVPEAVEYNSTLTNSVSETIKIESKFAISLQIMHGEAFETLIEKEMKNMENNLSVIRAKYPMLNWTEASDSDKLSYVQMVNQVKGDNQ